MKIYQVETENAVGRLLCHDITKIERGVYKGALYKKGHLIKTEDVDQLLDLGKKHIFVLELEQGELHEDEAGKRLAAAMAGPGLVTSSPSEGRVNLLAQKAGLLKIDVSRLFRINSVPDVVVSTLHDCSPVKKNDLIAGAKVIPLVVHGSTVHAVEEICAEENPPISILSYHKFKIGAIITGREVFEGRIKDGFAPMLNEKLAAFDLEAPLVEYSNDDAEQISRAILDLIGQGCDIIIVTGGMSVDPDDVSPTAIRNTGAKIIKYGAPVLPGAMFMLAYKDSVPIIGLPACGMYFKNTVLDIILPRLLAGQKVSAAQIAALGHGGLCRQCDTCMFPNCSFGKSAFTA